MKEPKYKRDLLAVIFLFLGLGFIILSCLSFANIINVTADSLVQDKTLLGQIFCFLGIILLFMQVSFRIVSNKKENLHSELILTGRKIAGRIERISLQKGIKYKKKSPFIVFYTYTYKDRIYHNKSCLLWDKPNLNKGDKVDVFVN